MRRYAKGICAATKRILREMVCGLDGVLRRVAGIREFSDDAECLLRLAKVRWTEKTHLKDGTAISCGDCIGELHLWNEHVAQLSGSRNGLAAGAGFRRMMIQSLRSLAVYVAIEPEMRDVVAFHGRISSIGHPARRHWESLAKGYDCEVFVTTPSFLEKLHDVLGFVLTVALTWVFNPRRCVMRGARLRRLDIWISRVELLRHFAPPCRPVSREDLQRAGD